MTNKKKKTLCLRTRRALCSILCLGLVFSQPGIVYGEQDAGYIEGTDAAAEPLATPTPTPDPHTEAYYQAPDSNSWENWPAGPNVEAASAVVLEVGTNTVLYSKNADQAQYPASITKIMTALLGCENLDPDAQMTISEYAAFSNEPGASSIYADVDEVFTVRQALMAVMLESANEVSVAIAEEVSGSTKKFVEKMNARARQIGCTNTHFNNPNGLPDETHYTTAGDMAKIARTAWYNPYFRYYVSTDLYEIPPTNKQPETRYLLNHHKMMEGRDYAYEGVLGGKTGYTDAAGSTLVTYARRGNLGLVVVVMGSVNGGYSDTAALLDYAFANFERISLKYTYEPVPVAMLPSEKYILKDGGNTYPYYCTRQFYATVPIGVTLDMLTSEKTLIENAAGAPRLKTTYYYGTLPVGYGIQYQRDILSDLLA